MSAMPAEATKATLRVGSRESPLALVQTHWVMAQLEQQFPELTMRLETFKTQGDRFLEAPLSEIGDKGLFVKELEEALLANQIDLAVHSLKDMLSVLPAGLSMQSVGKRADARDVLLTVDGTGFNQLPAGAVVGTASLRRVAQLKRLRSDLDYQTVRGNLQTRLAKLEAGEYQALILAAAGVERMGWQPKITGYFDPLTETIPAVGQGILAVEYRADDASTKQCLDVLMHPPTQTAMVAERAFLRQIEGGCRLPIGGYAQPISKNTYHLHGIVLSLDGTKVIAGQTSFTTSETGETNNQSAEAAGVFLAEHLLGQGAKALLQG